MSIITEFTIPAEAFALERIFETVPDAAVEEALGDDPTVDDVRTLDRNNGIGYLNVYWSEDSRGYSSRWTSLRTHSR